MSPTDQAERSAVTNTCRSSPKQQKLRCYLMCLLALLLTLSPFFICRIGLCILLVFSGLAATRYLRPAQVSVAKTHLLWLLLALGWTAGVLASGDILVCALCFCVSLLCWGVYLSYCAYAQQNKTLIEILAIAFQAVFYDPWAFFDPLPSFTPNKRKYWLAQLVYVAYILAAVLVLLILLLFQAESRMYEILRITLYFAQERAPLILSCLVLALFPAALAYSFLTKLKEMSSLALPPSLSWRKEDNSETPLWPRLCIMLTLVNWLFLLVELFYYVILNEPSDLRTDGLYDVLAIFILIFIGLTVSCCWFTHPGRTSSKNSVALGISLLGLVLFAGFRLFSYIMYYGLWNERAILSVVLLVFALPLLYLMFPSNRAPHRFSHGLISLLAVFLTIPIMIPSGVILSQVNATIFLYKYHTNSLDGQSNLSAELPLELADHDLCLNLMEGCGINGIPALLRLANIDNVTVRGEPLDRRVQDAILNCLCSDLGLPRTGDNQKDFDVVCSAANQMPRYRLPTSYAWALERLKASDQIFGDFVS